MTPCGKIIHATRAKAHRHINVLNRRSKRRSMYVYRCEPCGGFHVATVKGVKARPVAREEDEPP